MTSPDRPPLLLPKAEPLAVPADFAAKCEAMGVTLSAASIEKLAAFFGYLLAMNEQMNLTAITTPSEVWTRHGLDALSLLPLFDTAPADARVIDIGSGGGVPAIPLAIARPNRSFTLVESTQKKANFLNAVAHAVGATNIRVLPLRAEKLARGKERENFAFVTARAVGRLAVLAEITIPFAKAGGHILLVKGQKAEEELAEATNIIKKCGAEHKKTVATDTGRIVVLEKVSPTPRGIPQIG